MKRLIIFSFLLIGVLQAYAEDLPRAYMKAQYQEWYKYYNYDDASDMRTGTNKYILQIANGMSYYYDPQTFRIDSLESFPEGKAMLSDTYLKLIQDKMNGSGVDPFTKMGEMGLNRGKRYRARKDFGAGKITVWDSSMGDKYRYDVDMCDLTWLPGDSTKNILGYDCINATADYHGRRWEAWFAPELAIQDGPWQLCGLPGLILEAYTLDGDYGFSATGIQQCDEELKDPFETDKYFQSPRKAVLKMKAYSRDNRGAMISTMTGGKVNLKMDKPTKTVDFIETDYR